MAVTTNVINLKMAMLSHPKFWRLLTEVSKSVTEGVLRLHHAVKVVG